MVEWLAGKRVRGTSSERTPLGTGLGGTGVGGWVELGRTTLGSAGDTISVASLSDKRYYMILTDTTPSGQVRTYPRINNDSGSNYSIRYQKDGVADVTLTSQTYFTNYTGGFSSGNAFHVSYLANYASKEKLLINHSNENETLGAGTAPFRREYTGKWANTSNAVNRWDALNFGTGDFATGSEVVVLGWDPADTHTTNFWEELASVELGSAGDNLGSGTFSAKKYLWIQVFLKASGTYNTRFRVNSDVGSNYAVRWSDNGTADSSNTSENAFYPIVDGVTTNITTNSFMNMFIVNNASNEKLLIWNGIVQNTAGATNAPARVEGVAKWANTSSQITDIDIDNTSTGNYDTGSIIKVWGAD